MLTGQIKKIINIIDELDINLNKNQADATDKAELTETTNIYVNFDLLVEKIINQLRDIYGFENSLLAMVSPDQHLYKIEKYRFTEHVQDLFKPLIGRFYSLSIASGKIAECIIMNEILFLKELAIASFTSNKALNQGRHAPIKAALFIPINIRNKMIGSVVLFNHEKQILLRDEDKEVIRQLINYVALPLKTEQFESELRRE